MEVNPIDEEDVVHNIFGSGFGMFVYVNSLVKSLNIWYDSLFEILDLFVCAQ